MTRLLDLNEGWKLALRILTALIGIPILIGAIWVGPPWLTILVAAASLLGLWEFYRLSPKLQAPPVYLLGGLWTILFIITGQMVGPWYDYAPHAALGAGVLTALPWALLHHARGGDFTTWAYAVSGPVYVGFLLAHSLMLRELEGPTDNLGRNWLIFALAATFATDTGALFTGRAIGRHRMAPSISPGKTWEGAIGGFLCALSVAIALGALLQLSVPLWQAALVGVAVGVVAQIGDLAESRLKRAGGVKDAGSIIPGHGGILDRLDSIVFTMPVVYYLASVLL